MMAEWEPVLDRLRDDGFLVELTSVAYPVQLEGTLPDGESFYFRERGGLCDLGVGGDDPAGSAVWETSEVLWDETAPSRFLEPGSAHVVLARLLRAR